jgi:hypothetical protein
VSATTVGGPPGFLSASRLESVEAMELFGFVVMDRGPLAMLCQDQRVFRAPMTLIDGEMAYGCGDWRIQPAIRLTI